jgi:hypothetical protein
MASTNQPVWRLHCLFCSIATQTVLLYTFLSSGASARPDKPPMSAARDVIHQPKRWKAAEH